MLLVWNMDKKIISGYNISEKEIGLQSEIKMVRHLYSL